MLDYTAKREPRRTLSPAAAAATPLPTRHRPPSVPKPPVPSTLERPAHRPPQQPLDGPPWWALASAVIAPAVLIGGWIIAAHLQTRPYDALQETISVLAGEGADDRWFMTGALYIIAACYMVTAAGLRSMPSGPRTIIAMAGLAGLGLASFPQPPSGSNFDHMSFAVTGAVLLVLWPFLLSMHRPPIPLIPGTRHPREPYDAWDRILGRTGCIAVGVVVGLSALAMLIAAQLGMYLGVAERVCTALEALAPLLVLLGLRHLTASGRPNSGRGADSGYATESRSDSGSDSTAGTAVTDRNDTNGATDGGTSGPPAAGPS